MHSKFARVIIDRAIRRELDYAIPEMLSERLSVGARVRVPFRDRRALATVVALLEETNAKGIREIDAVIGEGPTLSESLLELARWISNYYCCPIETVMRSLLPQVIRKAEVGWKKQQFVEIGAEQSPETIEALRRRAPRQAELLEELNKANAPLPVADVLRRLSLNATTLRALAKRGLVKITERAVVRDPHAGEEFVPAPELVLNEEQTAAFAEVARAISSPETAKPILLHGVTGSGKTEIYLHAIRETLTRDRTAIVLVPEISLTPQTVERFKSRFAESQDVVAVLHSHLSEGERHDEWHKVHSGRARIVIGARSAVFAPLKNLGLIVVDEEHETSYKQEEAPRYHARDVAVVRAKIEKAIVLLGSATPSLESYQNALTKKYQLATLDPARRQLPDAAHPRDRSAPGTAERARADSIGETAERDRGSDRQTRTDHFVSESARFFHFITLQQVRQGPRLPELQRRAHLSSIDVAVKLSSLRTYRRGSEEMPGVRTGSADLRRLRNGKGGIVRRANFSECGRKTNGCRLDVAQGSVSRHAACISRG